MSNQQATDWGTQGWFFPGVSVDRSVTPAQAQGPIRLSGVDGRELGAIIRFPPFIPHDIGDSESVGDPTWIKRIDLNKGATGHQLRGFLVLDRNVVFHHYDTEDRAWRSKVLRWCFMGLQGSSDDISAGSSGPALYISSCGSTTGSGAASAGQRDLAVDDQAFFRVGDTIRIERDTGRMEEGVIDSFPAEGQIRLRANLLYAHGPDEYDIEGGSGECGATVVTYGADGWLIENMGPLEEDGSAAPSVVMVGGIGPTTTTTTQDVTLDAPRLNTPITAFQSSLSGSVREDTPVGPNGADMEAQYDNGVNGWRTFYYPTQPRTFKPNADYTWVRQLTTTAQPGYKFRVRVRLPDVGDGSPGPWSYSNEVTVGAAPPLAASSLASIDNTLYDGSFRMTGVMAAQATTTADAQVVRRNADGTWTTLGDIVAVGTGTFAVNLPNTGVPFRQGEVYSLRSRDAAGKGWSGDLSGADGRLDSIKRSCAAGWSTMATINAAPSQNDATISGVLEGGHGANAQGQVVKWSDVTDKWITIAGAQGMIHFLGQHGPNAWEIPFPQAPEVETGDLISVRTRVITIEYSGSTIGPWSGSLQDGTDSGDDGRLKWSAKRVL